MMIQFYSARFFTSTDSTRHNVCVLDTCGGIYTTKQSVGLYKMQLRLITVIKIAKERKVASLADDSVRGAPHAVKYTIIQGG